MSSDLTAAYRGLKWNAEQISFRLCIIKSPVYDGTDKIASFAIGVKSDDSRVISI